MVLALFACERNPRLRDDRGELRARPAELRFPRCFVGYPAGIDLSVLNTARGERSAELEVEGPFVVRTRTLRVPGGAASRVRVILHPEAPGEVNGRVVIRWDESELSVPVTAHVETAPLCVPTAECRWARFDPRRVACVEEPSPDGSACSNRCISRGTCRNGRCEGPKVDCSDGDACTDDDCEPPVGCVYRPARCPPPKDPCLAPVCDPLNGCSEAPVPDGTSCGSFDCVRMHVCRLGACVSEPTPEGTVCAGGSPCQESGVCRSRRCVQPPPSMTPEQWGYTAPPGKRVHFPGLADERGNVYWAECDGSGCELVSVEGAGRPRFRRRLSASPSAPVRGRLVLSGELVVSGVEAGHVRVFRSATGEEEWFVALRGASCRYSPGILDAPVLVSAGGDRLAASAFGSGCARGPSEGHLFTLSLADGELLWHRTFPLRLEGLLADEEGNLYFRLGAELVSLTPEGVERWRVTRPGSPPPLAVYRGLLFEDRGVALRAHDGRMAFDIRFESMGGEGSSPLLDEGVAYAFGRKERDWLYRIDSRSGRALWSSPGADGPRQPHLTGRGSVLFQRFSSGASRLVEISPAGHTWYSCPLPSADRYEEPAAFSAGRWTVLTTEPTGSQRIRSFWVGVPPASRGWATQGGSSARDGRPR